MTVQSIITNTVGIYIIISGKKNINQGILEILKVPMIYRIIIALALRYMNIQVWQPISSTITSLGNSMVPIALISLSAQLSETKYSLKIPKAYFLNLIRLVINPLIAYALVLILGLKGITSEIAIISSATPTAVNSALLAIQI